MARLGRATPNRPIILHGSSVSTATAPPVSVLGRSRGRRPGRYVHLRSIGTGLAISTSSSQPLSVIRSVGTATGTVIATATSAPPTKPVVHTGARGRAVRYRAGVLPIILRDYGPYGAGTNIAGRSFGKAAGKSVGTGTAVTFTRGTLRAVGASVQLTGAVTVQRSTLTAAGVSVGGAHANVVQRAVPRAGGVLGSPGAAVARGWSPTTAAAVMVNNGYATGIARAVTTAAGVAVGTAGGKARQAGSMAASPSVVQLTGARTVSRSFGTASSTARQNGSAPNLSTAVATVAAVTVNVGTARFDTRSIAVATPSVKTGRHGTTNPKSKRGKTAPAERGGTV